MPAPDPWGITIENRDGRFNILVDMFMQSGRSQRIGRAKRIAKRLHADGWCCAWCKRPVQEFRRADASYCSEGCRKRAARQRRAAREVGAMACPST